MSSSNSDSNKQAKCDRCQELATVVFLQKLKNGETIRENLCERCAMERGVLDSSIFLMSEEGEEMPANAEFFEQAGEAQPEPVTTACPSCGFGIEDIENTQRYGCGQCYTHFRATVEEMLRGIHRQSEHKGKLPEGLMERQKLSKELEAARLELAAAVKAEDYERAANLRDRLHELQKQLDLVEAP